MPKMRAIRGLRANPEVVNPGDVICPPYDVIAPELHQKLLDHSPDNAVRWILGENPDSPIGEEVFRGCGTALRTAFEEGRLIREESRSFYRYSIRYRSESGENHQLDGVLAAVESRPWGDGVLRHEEIRPHTVKRLVDQARCTRIDTGVVMLTCEGLETALAKVGAGSGSGELVFEKQDWNGTTHILHRLDDPQQVTAMEQSMADLPSAVADGHHRYTTALELKDDPELPAAGLVLAFLCDMNQEGLRILPTHRVWSWDQGDLAPEQVRDRIVEALDDGDGDRWSIEIPGADPTVLYCRQDASRPTLARRLADAVEQIGGLGAPATPHVIEDGRKILDSVERGVFCILPPISREEFWTRVLAGEIFPPKTTFFEPKISTGVVARFIDEQETS